MYTVSIQRKFRAEHAVTIASRREKYHAHRWWVKVEVASAELDADGLVCDFTALHGMLKEILEPFQDGNLNETPPFDELNPTAELVAKHVAEQLAPQLPDAVLLSAVTVTEAPGCKATYKAES
jgi:6-pyruvoyltetrahydropterin/6-carboxytetrahydropterin synthase